MLPREELEEQAAETKTQLDEITKVMRDVTAHVSKLNERVRAGELPTGKGISFLEVRHHLLLQYLIDLTEVMQRKLQGESIQGSDAVLRLVENRTVLEKMRPIEQKLSFQIDQLVKAALTDTPAENGLRVGANADAMEQSDDEEEEEEEEEDDGEPKLYRPPKIAAQHYDGDLSIKEQQERLIEKQKKRALSSSIIRDLKDEHDEGPSEIFDNPNLHLAKIDKSGKEREEYEEKYFVRKQLSKKEQNAAKKLRTMGDLNSLTHFGNIDALAGDGTDFDLPKKKRKSMASGKKKKGGKKKFRRH